MKHGEQARAEEREHLKLALATFALQLDAFEMRMQGVLLPFGKPDNLVHRRKWSSGAARIGPRKDDVIGGQ